MICMQIKISSEQSVAVPVAEHVRKVEAEVDVLKQLHHPNIVRYLVSHSSVIFLVRIAQKANCSLLHEQTKLLSYSAVASR